jgi:hypothetical protein
MKRTLFFAATALFLAACSNNQETANSANEATIDSMSQVLTRQHIIDSMNAVNATHSETSVNNTATETQGNGSSSYENNTSGSHAGHAGNDATVSNKAPGRTAAEIEAKRKADNRKKAKSAATGAVIGAGAGALGGAISGKNDHFKKENAAIGAGVGAAVGAGTGLLLQNRKLKKEREAAENK